jgi:hypothetical protein
MTGEDFIKQLQKEYYRQDNAATATPFIVEVQEKRSVGVMAEDATCCGSYDSSTVTEWTYEGAEGEGFDNMRDCMISALETHNYGQFAGTAEERADNIIQDCTNEEYLDETAEGVIESMAENMDITIRQYSMGYIWYPVEVCFTLKAAHQYMKANAHNHGTLRTWIRPVERRNWELIEVMKFLQLKNKADDIHSKKRGGMNQGETKYLFQIIKDYLKTNNYNGLRSEEHGCTCTLGDDLFGCNYDVTYCVPYRAEEPSEKKVTCDCEYTITQYEVEILAYDCPNWERTVPVWVYHCNKCGNVRRSFIKPKTMEGEPKGNNNV